MITRAQISQRMLSIGLGCEREVMLGAGHGVVSRGPPDPPKPVLLCCCCQISDHNRVRQEEVILTHGLIGLVHDCLGPCAQTEHWSNRSVERESCSLHSRQEAERQEGAENMK